jgi:anti-sigma B factor antagonist
VPPLSTPEAWGPWLSNLAPGSATRLGHRDNSPGLLREVLTNLELPISTMTLDLALVTYVDSSGLGTLVAAKHRADQRGIAFQLRGVSEQTRRIFEITDLAEMFGLAD